MNNVNEPVLAYGICLLQGAMNIQIETRPEREYSREITLTYICYMYLDTIVHYI